MSVPVSGTFYVTAVVDGENAIEYRIKPNIAAIKMDPNNIQSVAASFDFVKAEGSVETPLSVYPRLRIYDKAGSVLLDNKITSASTGYSYTIPQNSYGTASSLNVTIYSDNAHTNQLATVTLNIVRETPRYAGIIGEWSDGLEFNNGNYILIDGIVYVWSNPIPGNSSIPPLNDIQNNPNTTSWVAYDYWPLIGTDFLLARRIKSDEIETENLVIQNGARIGDLYIYDGGIYSTPAGDVQIAVNYMRADLNGFKSKFYQVALVPHPTIPGQFIEDVRDKEASMTPGKMYARNNKEAPYTAEAGNGKTAIDLVSGFIDGMSVKTRQITLSTELTHADGNISCYNTDPITVTLPASPQLGKQYTIRRGNASVTISGNGKTLHWGTSSGATLVMSTLGNIFFLFWDGTYWCIK